MGAQVRRKTKFIPSCSSGGGSGEGLLLEKPPPPELSLNQRPRRLCQPPRPQLPKQKNAPTLHGREPSKEESSLFPAALRERGAGGEALLLEKRPLPPESPHRKSFREGARREGPFLQKRPLPRITNILLILSRVVQQTTGEDHAALAGSEGKKNGVVVPLGLVAERQALFTGGNGGANIGQG